jgi:hypothetical protein
VAIAIAIATAASLAKRKLSLVPMTLSVKWWPVRKQPERHIVGGRRSARNTKI